MKKNKSLKSRGKQTKRRTKWQKFYFAPSPKMSGILIALVLFSYGTTAGLKHLIHETQIFAVEKVEVRNLKYLDSKEILNLAGIEFERPLYHINVDSVVKNILQNKYVEAVSVSRNIPSTLIIDVRERTPELFLLDKTIYMVDKKGIILKSKSGMEKEDLPFVTGLTVTELLADRSPLIDALDLIDKIKEVDETLLSFISEVYLQKEKWPVFYLINGGARLSLGEREHYERIYYWYELFNKTDIIENLPTIKQLDFTFAKRVVIEKKG
jgi:cell division protein FtsQ